MELTARRHKGDASCFISVFAWFVSSIISSIHQHNWMWHLVRRLLNAPPWVNTSKLSVAPHDGALKSLWAKEDATNTVVLQLVWLWNRRPAVKHVVDQLQAVVCCFLRCLKSSLRSQAATINRLVVNYLSLSNFLWFQLLKCENFLFLFF